MEPSDDAKTMPRPRGRPAEFDREAAIKCAMDEFWKRGFTAVSVSDLADAMSITRSSFYNGFGDREAVFRQALEAYERIAPDAVLDMIAPGQPVRPVIRKMFREICRVRAADLGARGCLVVNSISELGGSEGRLSGYIREAVLARMRTYERLLRQAANQGEIDKPQDIRAAALAFFAFAIGLNTVSKVVRDEGELWRICEAFLDGIGFRRKRRPGRE
jgi:TetR/AcrR family transcriptional repressor of nem operon